MKLCGTVKFDIPILDHVLPKGVLRRSAIVVAGGGGTGKSALVSLIASKFAERGEPVVYVTLDDDPMTVAESFMAKGHEINRLLSEKLLLIVDGYSSRYGIEPDIRVEEELPTLDLTALQTAVRRVVDRYKLRCKGLVVIDSLNALLARFEASMVFDLVNALRASIVKNRGITTIFTIHTPTQVFTEIAASLEYMVDVMIWLRYHAEALEAGLPVRELLVKKAKGVPVVGGWVRYIIGEGGFIEVAVKREEKR